MLSMMIRILDIRLSMQFFSDESICVLLTIDSTTTVKKVSNLETSSGKFFEIVSIILTELSFGDILSVKRRRKPCLI